MVRRRIGVSLNHMNESEDMIHSTLMRTHRALRGSSSRRRDEHPATRLDRLVADRPAGQFPLAWAVEAHHLGDASALAAAGLTQHAIRTPR